MEGFSFVDIFATKGIEYLAVLGFLAVFILFLRFLNTPVSKPVPAEVPAVFARELVAPSGDLFYAPGHSWAAVGAEGGMSIGVDGFLARLVGSVDRIELPRRGVEVSRGDKLFTLHRGNRKLAVPSPLSGTVDSLNTGLLESPGLLKGEADAWLVRMKPAALAEELDSLRIGARARAWMEKEVARLRDFLSSIAPQPATAVRTLLDGGLPVEGALALLDDSAWESFAGEFLPAGEEER